MSEAVQMSSEPALLKPSAHDLGYLNEDAFGLPVRREESCRERKLSKQEQKVRHKSRPQSQMQPSQSSFDDVYTFFSGLRGEVRSALHGSVVHLIEIR